MSRHPLGGALRASEEPREPRFMRALSDYGPLHSAFTSKIWAHFISDRVQPATRGRGTSLAQTRDVEAGEP